MQSYIKDASVLMSCEDLTSSTDLAVILRRAQPEHIVVRDMRVQYPTCILSNA
jgi:hypothetical protein